MAVAAVNCAEDFLLQPLLSMSVRMIAGLTPACVTLLPRGTNESFMLILKHLSKPLSST